jgi:AraC-like DNA-binding protein
MTVKILTPAQKGAVKLLYSLKRKNQKELALALGVSERTIQRAIEEESAKNPELIDSSDEAKQVIALLYKHKITFKQLEQLLIHGHSKAESTPLTMGEVQRFLCKCTQEQLATLFYTSGLAKLVEVVQQHQAVTTLTPTAPIPKSAQQPLNLGA